MQHVRLRCWGDWCERQLTFIAGLEMAPLIGMINLIGTICLPMSFNTTRAWWKSEQCTIPPETVRGTWRDVTWRDVTWRDVTWRDVTWRDVTWRLLYRSYTHTYIVKETHTHFKVVQMIQGGLDKALRDHYHTSLPQFYEYTQVYISEA